MKYLKVLLASVIGVALLCSSALADERTELTGEQLSSAPAALALVQNRWFMPTEDSAEALHEFAGTLVIPDHRMFSEPAEIRPADILGKKTQL
ncbi:MAG: hypothetical protein OEM63_12960, partial [Gammaproteobacteria bacterium]|nr:hypothetical protein [Gammaproteobacteria bacterium]